MRWRQFQQGFLGEKLKSEDEQLTDLSIRLVIDRMVRFQLNFMEEQMISNEIERVTREISKVFSQVGSCLPFTGADFSAKREKKENGLLDSTDRVLGRVGSEFSLGFQANSTSGDDDPL